MSLPSTPSATSICTSHPRLHSLFSCSSCKLLFKRPGINPHFLNYGCCPNCTEEFSLKSPVLYYIRIPKYKCWSCDRLMRFTPGEEARCEGCGLERQPGMEVIWVRSLRIEEDPEEEIKRHYMGKGCRNLPCCEGLGRRGVKMWIDV